MCSLFPSAVLCAGLGSISRCLVPVLLTRGLQSSDLTLLSLSRGLVGHRRYPDPNLIPRGQEGIPSCLCENTAAGLGLS